MTTVSQILESLDIGEWFRTNLKLQKSLKTNKKSHKIEIAYR